TTWSSWTALDLKLVNHAATISVDPVTLERNQAIAASSLFSASDADGDAIVSYQFWDNTTDLTSGHLVVGGVDQKAQALITLSADQLAQAAFRAGTTLDTVNVRAFDGTSWSSWVSLDLTIANHAPTIAATSAVVSRNENVAVSSLFTT